MDGSVKMGLDTEQINEIILAKKTTSSKKPNERFFSFCSLHRRIVRKTIKFNPTKLVTK
jgi:hypothetical protein